MTIADDLLSVAETIGERKAALKAAIEAKGVTVGDAPFSEYPALILLITSDTTPPPPADAGFYDEADGKVFFDETDGKILIDEA